MLCEILVIRLPHSYRASSPKEYLASQILVVDLRIDRRLADVSMPHHVEMPQLGGVVSGVGVDHAGLNRQVKVRLDEWTADLAGR